MKNAGKFCGFLLLALTVRGQTSDAASAPPQRREPKGRQEILRQLESDLRTSMARATLTASQRQKLDKSIQTLVNAEAQQQEQRKVDKGKIKGALKDLEKIEKARPFAPDDQTNLDHDQALLRANLDRTAARRAQRVAYPRRRPYGFPPPY